MRRALMILILVIAFLLRVPGITTLPAGFTPDEASFGYDAYSLLQTGKDQWGSSFPATFKSFGDYKLPIYTYVTMPSVALFGLTKFAVRLPNAIIGTMAVFVTMLLVRELVDSRDRIERLTPLLAGLFLAFSYWHISLSRGAFEANLTTFFLTTGAYLFLLARKNQWLLSLSMLFFGINMFTYHAARIVTPCIVICLLYLYRNSFPRQKKYTLASAIFLFFFLAAIISLLSGSAVRASTSTLIAQNLGSGNLRASLVNSGMPLSLARGLYNEPLFKLSKLTQNYISYFTPTFLYTDGAREATYGMVPQIGVLTVVEYIGFLFFAWVFIKRRKMSLAFLVIWLLIAPVPAAISVGPGNAANRAAILMPAIQIAAAIGMAYGVTLLKTNFQKTAIVLVFVMTAVLGSFTFLRYAYEQPVVASNGMMYGMRELFFFLREYPTKHVILSRSISEAHIYPAFYDPIPPDLYQKAARNWNFQEKGLNWVDQQEGYFVGRYVVSSIDPIRDFQDENTFIVGTPNEMPPHARVVKTILTADLKPLWVVAEKQ